MNIDEHEMKAFLEAVYETYQYDFRQYSHASLTRRVGLAAERLANGSITELMRKVLADGRLFANFLEFITVNFTDMFRDPVYYRMLREKVMPIFHTYPSLRVWVAGCSTGEEAYSLAILLDEEGLLERTLIYATDINGENLRKAEAGIYLTDRFRKFTENHRASGGTRPLSDYYQASHGHAMLDRRLRKRMVFSDHSLATDSVFAEMQLVSCRNVLIYFRRPLQERAFSLFRDSLCPRGFLGLGTKETVRFSDCEADFEEVSHEARIFRRKR